MGMHQREVTYNGMKMKLVGVMVAYMGPDGAKEIVQYHLPPAPEPAVDNQGDAIVVDTVEARPVLADARGRIFTPGVPWKLVPKEKDAEAG